MAASISSRDSTEKDNWHLFNDFLVRKVPKEDALHFAASWKMPAILAYQIASGRHAVDDSWKSTLDPALLYHQYSLKFVSPSTSLLHLLPTDPH